MRKLILVCGAAAAFMLGLAFANPAAADGLLYWTTEDGVHSYTDDPKAVPKRYKRQVQSIRSQSLSTYERFTPTDSGASDSYAQQLADRLAHLRQVNAVAPGYSAPAYRGGHARGPGGYPTMISVATGSGNNAPRVQFPAEGAPGEPLVLEPVITKRAGDTRTRRATIVSQGGRTVAVLKGPRHNRGPHDIEDEDALTE
jgi:hypothetical protein